MGNDLMLPSVEPGERPAHLYPNDRCVRRIAGFGVKGPHRKRRYDTSTRGGSTRSAVRRSHSARVKPVKQACPECPWHAGPKQVLCYLPRYTHRVAISNRSGGVSNSASPPSTVRRSRPCGVVVSTQALCSERKVALAAPMAVSVLSRSRVERARWSSRVTMTTSPSSSSASSRASCLRSDLAPYNNPNGIIPAKLYRKSHRETLDIIGLRPTQVDEEIRNGTLPPPAPLTAHGKAAGWWGFQLVKYVEQRRELAQQRATARVQPKSRERLKP